MSDVDEMKLTEGSSDQPFDQYLTFSLENEEYGVDILRVQEIRGWETVTRIPNAPTYVKGVLNLRGSIVPIYDLRHRFMLKHQEPDKDTVVIVLRTESSGSERSIGVVVDAVSDVHDTYPTDIRSTPEFGIQVPTDFISGLISIDDKMIMLLDVDKLLDDQDDLSVGEAA